MAPNAANERSLVKEIQIPGLANEAIINHMLRQGHAYAQSRYSGRCRLEQGLNYAKLDTDLKPGPHVFDAVKWRLDITLLTREQVADEVLVGISTTTYAGCRPSRPS